MKARPETIPPPRSGFPARLAAAVTPVALMAAATAVVAFPAAKVFFSLDDLPFLRSAAGLAPWAPGLKRFLSTHVFFDVGWRLWGTDPVGYHLAIAVLHVLNGWLVSRIAGRLGLSRRASTVAGVAFVAAPVAFTVLHWISCVQEVLMTCAALLATLLVLKGRDAAAIAAAAAALLCKESVLLLLPALAIALPLPRRRRLTLAVAGVALAAAALAFVGAVATRTKDGPYAVAFGINVPENLLTYLAWLARPWVWYPDRQPRVQPELWAWGLVAPAAVALAAFARRAWRAPAARAALVFLALLAPVLPLTHHSYLYYLYLPLVPFLILAAAGLDRLQGRARAAMWLLPACLLLLSGWQGERRRAARSADGVVLDPVLRYAALAETAIGDLRAADASGDLLIVGPFLTRPADLVGGGAAADAPRELFLMVGRALHDGADIPLFLPAVTSAEIRVDLDDGIRWRDREICLTWDEGEVLLLGRGAAGRRKLAGYFYREKDFARARRELLAVLGEKPDDPVLIDDIGAIALKLGNAAEAREMLGRLEKLLASPSPPAGTAAARADLAAQIAAADASAGGR